MTQFRDFYRIFAEILFSMLDESTYGKICSILLGTICEEFSCRRDHPETKSA